MVFPHLLAKGPGGCRNDLGREIVDVQIECVIRQRTQFLELRQGVRVADRTVRRHRRVVPAVVLDDLAAAVLEGREVRAWGRGDGRERRLDLLLHIREVDVAAPLERWARHRVHVVTNESAVAAVIGE